MYRLKNNPVALIILCSIALFFIHLDALWVNIMEARNFTSAREMLQDNNWLLTTLNGDPRYEKPPLPTWLTAISASIFGIKSLFGLRLPAAIITVVLLLSSYKLALKTTTHKIYALTSTLILATSFYIVFSGRNGQWDIFTHGFMMLCIYNLYQLFTVNTKSYKFAFIAAVFFGCSFMSKGPVSLYALLLPFLIAYGVVYKYKKLQHKIGPLVVFIVVSIVLSGWWHYYTYVNDPETVLAITQKETGNWTSYNVRPFYYYWSFFTQSGVWTIPAFISLLYPYLKKSVFDKKGYQFTFLWTIAAVVLLSIIPEKKSRYLLPVLIPLALNTGYYMVYLFDYFKQLKSKKETIPVYFNFGLIACIGLLFPIGGGIFLKNVLTEIWVWFSILSLVLVLISIFMLIHLRKKNIHIVFYLTITFIASIICFGMPMAKFTTINPAYKSFTMVREDAESRNIIVYEFSYFTPEIIWDYGSSIPVISNGDVLKLPNDDRFGLLIAEQDEEIFEEKLSGYTLEKIGRYDINPQAPENRQHKNRLWRDYYIVTKK